MKVHELEGFLLIKSSNKNYHAVFNRYLSCARSPYNRKAHPKMLMPTLLKEKVQVYVIGKMFKN